MKEPQLANVWSPKKDYGVASWWASPKMDGMRAVYRPKKPMKGFWTRSWGRLSGFDRLADALEPLCEARGLSFVDGELFIPELDAQRIQGAAMSLYSPDKARMEFHAFAVGGKFGDTAAMIKAIPEAPAFGAFRVPYEKILNTPEAVTAACERYVAQGFEGVVLRHPDVPYFHGRSDHLLKLKAIREADLAIVDMRWGTGAVTGTVGKVLVEGEIDGRLVRCWVGAGLSMEERDRLAADEAPWGNMLTVAFQSLTDEPGEDGAFALRFPRALGLKDARRSRGGAMMGTCALCGRDAPEGRDYCHACVWKARWAEHILTAPEGERRRKRSHLLAPVELDAVEARAAFVGGRGERHETTLKACSCQDFSRGDGAWPCKHIFRLAEELGLIQCEAFAPGEKDYTTAAPAREPAPIPTGPLGGKTLVFTGKLASMERAEAQARAEALGAVVSSTVSARTALLVAGEKGGSKLEKAQRLGVPVIGEAEFLDMLLDMLGGVADGDA